MPSLATLIGSDIIIRSIPLNEAHPITAKLHAIDTGGIWIESQDATDHWLHELKKAAAPKTLVFFLPFAQILWIMSSTSIVHKVTNQPAQPPHP